MKSSAKPDKVDSQEVHELKRQIDCLKNEIHRLTEGLRQIADGDEYPQSFAQDLLDGEFPP